jgi:hypothetical protein
MRHAVTTGLLALALSACRSHPPAPPQGPPSQGQSADARDAEGVPVPGRGDLRVRLLARKTLPYDPSTFGLGGTFVGIELTNVSKARVEVDVPHATFVALREGVAFPCEPMVDADHGVREPSALDPGATFAYRRQLDCHLALPGTYTIAVRLALGHVEPVPVGEVRIELVARGPRVPRPHASMPGLFAMVSGDSASRPQGDAKGGYAVVVALVNGSARPIDLPASRALFRVTRVGTALPCMDEPVALHPPARLAPGATHVERVPVSCVMNKPGAYDVDAALLVGQERESAMGRVRLSVSEDPLLFSAPRAY